MQLIFLIIIIIIIIFLMKFIHKYIISFIVVGSLITTVIGLLILPILTNKGKELYLPDVRGLNIVKAQNILEKEGFNTIVIKSNYNENYIPNHVITMTPRAFSKIKKNRTIKLKIAGNKESVIFEDFNDESIRNVKISINRNNLLIDTLIYEYNSTIKKDHIIEQYPKANTILKSLDKVTFIVSLGSPPDYYIVPNLININLKRGREVISKTGLLLGTIKYEYNTNYLNNTILEQNLTEGMKLSFPSKINLIVSTDRIQNK